MVRRALLMLCLSLLPEITFASNGVTLTVTVTGVTPNRGQVVVSLFDSEAGYMKEAVVSVREKVPDEDRVNVVFTGLATGTYAASVYYDQDSDGELDTGLFRIPSEPVGFSNNARGRFGPAKWKQTQFPLTADTKIVINVGKAAR